MTEPQQVHIFLDLDGVLADMDLHLHQENKLTPDGKTKWDELDYQFWVTVPVFEGAREFYDAIKKMGVAKFLTAPVLGEECFSGKAAWIQKFIPERGKFALMDLIICPGADKGYLARPNHILVDDREKNINEWVAAGGIGIHHTGDFTATMEKLEQAIATLGISPAQPVQNSGKPPEPNL